MRLQFFFTLKIQVQQQKRQMTRSKKAKISSEVEPNGENQSEREIF